MRIDLDGRSALVTGSTRGIGHAVARALATCGASVVVNGRSVEAVTAATASLADSVPGARFSGVAGDVTSPDEVRAVVERAPEIDILVCNAAVFDWSGFFETDDATWLRHFEINVMAAVRLARAYMPGMLARDRGRIVLIASEAGLNVPADMIHYGVSKAAEIALARGLAELTAGTAVTVNTVLPGPTASSNAEEFLSDHASKTGIAREEAEAHLIGAIRPTSLLKRLATVDEVANMVAYACSPLASATNGAALRAEGGILRHFG